MRPVVRRLSIVATVALATSSVAAADAAKPNTLTPKQIAQGWILLFDGQTPFGWKIDGDSKVKDGLLVLGGTKATQARTTTVFDWLNAELQFESRWEGTKPPRCSTSRGDWQTLEPVADGKFALSKRKQKSDSARRPPAAPHVFEVPAGTTLMLRNVKLRPLSAKPIFNGKDLTGWKEIPDRKSKFTVTDKGEINVSNGSGDLHTEGQWDDFILQLDIISYGKHLNSGIFFRALPGQFWSGYESQIRNQWKGDDRADPVDFGTGGIYNHQRTRKVVSSDKEWFTKTVVVHGKHMAVWINGYQVSDFTDKRHPNRSARKGCKVDKGTISIQGHDPTTNLSFRNIRLAVLPKAPQEDKEK